MKFGPFDILFPPALALVVLALGWISVRPIYAGRPLPSHVKKLILYGSLFALGMAYSMAIVAMFNLRRPLWIVLTAFWAMLLGLIAWWRFRQKKGIVKDANRPISGVLSEIIPAVGLLITLIGGAVEWEYIFRGEGRWWVGLLWIVGIILSVAAARHNRRATVIPVLRALVVLLILGAIAERTMPALVAVIVSGLALLLFEKFWRVASDNR